MGREHLKDLCLVQRLQSLRMVLLNIFQFLQSMFLQLQGLHVNLLAFHLREELIHSLREMTTSDFRKGILRVNINPRIIHIMHLVKTIKLQIWALCMLGKEKWVEFVISERKRRKSNVIKRNSRFLPQDTLMRHT